MSVSILVSERESVVTLTSTSVCESTAESIVVLSISIMAIVVLAIVVMAIVVIPIVVLPIVVLPIVVAVVVIGGITATATVVGSPTKQIIEEPFIPSVLPLFCLSPLPASVTGAIATRGKEEPGLTIINSLAFATFPAIIAIVDVAVVQSTSDCWSKNGSTEGT